MLEYTTEALLIQQARACFLENMFNAFRAREARGRIHVLVFGSSDLGDSLDRVKFFQDELAGARVRSVFRRGWG
jgi:hypothetical protein